MSKKGKSDSREGQWAQRAKLVEEFAALDGEMAALKPRQLRHQKLRELILSWYPATPPEEEVLVRGVNHDVVISARDSIRSVTPEGKKKLYKLWGAPEFIAKAAIFLKFLPDPDDRAELYSKQGLTGPRHLRVLARASATADTAAA